MSEPRGCNNAEGKLVEALDGHVHQHDWGALVRKIYEFTTPFTAITSYHPPAIKANADMWLLLNGVNFPAVFAVAHNLCGVAKPIEIHRFLGHSFVWWTSKRFVSLYYAAHAATHREN